MAAGRVLWEPDPSFARKTSISAYMKWLEKRGASFDSYGDLWKWSVDDIDGFWGSIWKYFDVADADYPVLEERKMPGAKWFPGADVNFAGHVFRQVREGTALICKAEGGREQSLTWESLEKRTAALAATLREMGVAAGDRVAAYIANGPEAVVGLLACASVGAVWSSCPPEFGAPAVVDRFGQIGPKVLLAADGYSYGGKWIDRSGEVKKIAASLPGAKVIGVGGGVAGASWDDAVSGKARPEYEPLPFDQPLWVLYSSGTTGLPKPIVHSQGGILVELLKELALHNDIRQGDRFFWFTTTGWMMWNYLVGGLLLGATLVLYAGSPGYPSLDALWDLAESTDMTFLGTSAAFLSSCEKAGLEPRSTHGLKRLRGIGSTGSPLSEGSFDWVYSKAKEEVWLASISGGTDVCTAFVGGCPVLPVNSGEIQCRCLGAKVEAYDAEGKPVVGKMGELVITEPMPSMPLFFWGDEDGSRYRESYFSAYPGVWRHGDWIQVTPRGTCVIYGRSDATIKRLGVRIGTSEIYRSVESMPEVTDCVAVDVERPGGQPRLVLFVVLAAGRKLDQQTADAIRQKVKSDLSPRYVPDEVVEVESVPRTLSGKRLEVPIKRILMGADPWTTVSAGALADPTSLQQYVEYAKRAA